MPKYKIYDGKLWTKRGNPSRGFFVSFFGLRHATIVGLFFIQKLSGPVQLNVLKLCHYIQRVISASSHPEVKDNIGELWNEHNRLILLAPECPYISSGIKAKFPTTIFIPFSKCTYT